MKIQIEKKDLLGTLGRAQHIVEKRNTMPVLINVLLDAQSSGLKVFATDLEVSLIDEVPIQLKEAGKVAVNARNFYDLVKELSDGLISVEKKDNNWIKISQGKAVFNLVGVPPEEYPLFPAYQTKEFVKIDKKILLEMIEKTIYSVSNDETRYHLNGVYFEKLPGTGRSLYRMVATDGHRLSLIDRPVEGGLKGPQEGVIIPRKGLNEIRKLLEGVEDSVNMAIEGSQLVVCYKGTTFMIRLIEGKYPNYQQLIPQNFKEHILVPRETLLSSLKRVSLMANVKSKGVTLSITTGKLEIASNNPELGDAKEEIEVDYKGKEMKIAFNAKYMLDVLTTMDEDIVSINLNDQLSPGILRPLHDKTYTCLVMPMRT